MEPEERRVLQQGTPIGIELPSSTLQADAPPLSDSGSVEQQWARRVNVGASRWL